MPTACFLDAFVRNQPVSLRTGRLRGHRAAGGTAAAGCMGPWRKWGLRLIHEGAHVVPTWGRGGGMLLMGQDVLQARTATLVGKWSHKPGVTMESALLFLVPRESWENLRPLTLEGLCPWGRGRHRAHHLSWASKFLAGRKNWQLTHLPDLLASLILSQLISLVLPQLPSSQTLSPHSRWVPDPLCWRLLVLFLAFNPLACQIRSSRNFRLILDGKRLVDVQVQSLVESFKSGTASKKASYFWFSGILGCQSTAQICVCAYILAHTHI